MSSQDFAAEGVGKGAFLGDFLFYVGVLKGMVPENGTF